jgi:hypothetical protein
VDDGWERVWQNVVVCPFRGDYVGTGCTVLDEPQYELLCPCRCKFEYIISVVL